MIERRAYQGVIREGIYKEDGCALFLGDMKEPLVLAVSVPVGELLSVRYLIADELVELPERPMKHLYGDVVSTYQQYCSEIDWHIHAREVLTVGSHDLIYELRSRIGEFCHLEMVYWNEDHADATTFA